MIDAVLSFHMNPMACGVTKFNVALAHRLGVPHDYFGRIHQYSAPLVSLKFAESQWRDWFPGSGVRCNHPYHLFAHDWRQEPGFPAECWVNYARTVTAADPAIADLLRTWRPDVKTAFCPSTLGGNANRGGYRVLVFGMAHKLLLPCFWNLKQELDITHPDYTIELSTAVHEGNPWDVALTESVEAMRGIFGDKLRVLGFLGDDALAKELRDVDAVAAFYTPALRANNTTYWAAVEAGKTIYTNRDEHSPQEGDPPASWDRLCALIQGAA